MLDSFIVGFIVFWGTGNPGFFCFPVDISLWKEGHLSTETLCDQTSGPFLLALPGETLSSQKGWDRLGWDWLCSTVLDAKREN